MTDYDGGEPWTPEQALAQLQRDGFKQDLLSEEEHIKTIKAALVRNPRLEYHQLRRLIIWANEAVQNYNALRLLLDGKASPMWSDIIEDFELEGLL